MQNTLEQFDAIIARCKEVFVKKTHDYGTAWRILRPSSLTDQLYIKAKRIRSIEEKGIQKVDEPLAEAYSGLINYSLLALIQLAMPAAAPLELPAPEVVRLYDLFVQNTRDLLEKKNHDYGEVWREMRISSITDLILMKLLRVKQIEDNQGQTLISEGLDANYYDIINYAVFALILLEESGARTDKNANK